MMTGSLKIAPIVEGDGEVAAAPILLRRICLELLGGTTAHVLRPIRQPRSRLIDNKNDCLGRSLEFAVRKLRQASVPGSRDLVLVLIDADDDCAARAGPRLQELVAGLRPDVETACILAVWEYETWFAAASSSLARFLDLTKDGGPPFDPEGKKLKKRWVSERFRGVKYSETVDQPKLTAAMDLHLCRKHSPSFDKLCRELEKRCVAGN